MADTLDARVRRRYGRDDRENEYDPASPPPAPEDTFATAVNNSTAPENFEVEPAASTFQRTATPEPQPATTPEGPRADAAVGGMSGEQREDVKATLEQKAEKIDTDEDVVDDEDDAVARGLKVDPQVYDDFKTQMNTALQDYRSEVDHTRRAKLFGAIIQALGMMAIARTTHGWAGGPETVKFATPDYEADLAQATRNFNAVSGTLKEGLSTEEKRVEGNRSELKLTEYEEARKERKAQKEKDTKEKAAKTEQKGHEVAATSLTKSKDKFVAEFNAIMDGKGLRRGETLSDEEKLARIELALTKSGLPITPETRKKLLGKISVWDNISEFSGDKEIRTQMLNDYLTKEVMPAIESTRHPPVWVSKDGMRKQVPAEAADELVRDFGWIRE